MTPTAYQDPSKEQRNDPFPRALARSPHPYHRRGPSLLNAESDEERQQSSKAISSGLLTPKLSSESGTEADDEGSQGVRKLPAPPLRPSKGLRGHAGDHEDDHSPQSTPPLAYGARHGSRFESTANVRLTSEHLDGPGIGKSEKDKRKRRSEVFRRLTEVGILSVVCAIVCFQANVRATLELWYQELATFLGTTVLLYVLYPIRLLRRKDARRLRIPTTFDPAPLLYPVFLPFIVAASLAPTSYIFLLPNMILGLSSIPPSAIPYYEQTISYSHSHWLIATVPLILSQNSIMKARPARPLALKTMPSDSLDPESLVLLYPLQKCVVPILRYLTATSLDESEIQLLSTILLNLLLFTSSPQMEILKSVTWIGGLGLYCLCSKVLEWEIALARLPLWRLRKNENRPKSERGWLASVDADICGRFIRDISNLKSNDSSDDGPSLLRLHHTRPSLSLKTDSAHTASATTKPIPASAVNISPPDHADSEPSVKLSRARRHTFSTISDTKLNLDGERISKGRAKRRSAPGLQPFLLFTPAQVSVRKWLYAGYTYLMTMLLILVPIRRYIRDKALNGHEPFGWAIGYLGGNISALRFWVVSNAHDNWIRLPTLESLGSPQVRNQGWFERIRQVRGEANVRIGLSAYCLCVLLSGLGVVLRLTSVAEVDTRRKGFHGIMVAMFLPTVYIDPCFVALALALALAAFLLLDLFRASQLPPISRPLTNFLAPYVDGRDHRGPVVVSHIFLLIGCAIPLWLSLAGVQRTGSDPWQGWDVAVREISMVSGIICVGLGDAAASLIGRRFGRHKWYWGGGKSLEGSIAFVVAVSVGLLAAYSWLVVGGWRHYGPNPISIIVKCIVAGSGASLTEAVLTGANDNVVVPVILWLLVRGLHI